MFKLRHIAWNGVGNVDMRNLLHSLILPEKMYREDCGRTSINEQREAIQKADWRMALVGGIGLKDGRALLF